MNKQIIDQFRLLTEHIKNTKKTVADNFRLRQIKNALLLIEKYPEKITKGLDLKGVAGIGNGIMDRIDEILKYGKLSEITSVSREEGDKLNIVSELTTVINIGEKVAEKLIEKYAIKSVEDLIKKYEKGKVPLNDKVALGLKYYKKVEEHIPRSEVKKIEKLIKGAVKKVDKKLQAIVCGSYRRGKPFSNDIDILLFNPEMITKKDAVDNHYIDDLISLLSKPYKKNGEQHFLIDNLTEEGQTKYMGFCQLDGGKVRRIDIRFLPYESYYAALLYFTGSGNLNKKMRLVAKKQGYLLNEYGLYKGKKMVPIESEEDVFDVLGMEYLEPSERNL